MLSKELMGGGAVLMAVLIALTQALGWPGSLQYLWALIVLVWGILAFTGK